MIVEFEQVIGYKFQNKNLIRQAFTHSSYANEKRMAKTANNERLEFLGDAVLELVTSEYIFESNSTMSEGEMTKLRASMVCEPTLALCAKDVNLGFYLLLGKGEASTGGRERNSILSDAMESVIGAIYLDGGFTNAKEFIQRVIFKDIANKQLFYDSKTILQEMIQSNSKEMLHYEVISEEGPDHNKKFTVAALVGKKEIAQGIGRTKKAAEQEAAYKAIIKLKQYGGTNVSKKH